MSGVIEWHGCCGEEWRVEDGRWVEARKPPPIYHGAKQVLVRTEAALRYL